MENNTLNILYTLKGIGEKDFNKINVAEITGILDKFTNFMIRNNITGVPTNISEFLELLYNRPINTYIPQIESNEPFLTRDGEINIAVREEIEEDEVEEKVQQETMKKLLELCRKKHKENDETYNWEEVYKNARQFIGEHYLIERIELDKYLQQNMPDEVSRLIKGMYESEYHIKGSYTACPVCGKKINRIISPECSNEVCNYYISEEGLQGIERHPKTKLVHLHSGIYRYILSPGISELRLYNKLSKRFKTCQVQLYPGIDEYDLSVSNHRGTIYIDVKDTSKPGRLVKLLKEDSNLDKLLGTKNLNVYLVIPNHRVKIYRMRENMKYIKELRNSLSNEGIEINIVQERFLISKIEEALKI